MDSPAQTIIVLDADAVIDGIAFAVHAVDHGDAWAIPHKLVHRLTEEGTRNVMSGEPWRGQPLEEKAYLGLAGGGCVVASKQTLLDALPDQRFLGWGQEDESWGIALRTLYGAPWRGSADLVHLWHPAQPRMTRTRGSQESWLLRRAYFKAMDDQDAMRKLLEEGKCRLPAC